MADGAAGPGERRAPERSPDVIVALDFPDPAEAFRLVDRLPAGTWNPLKLQAEHTQVLPWEPEGLQESHAQPSPWPPPSLARGLMSPAPRCKRRADDESLVLTEDMA